MRPPRMRRGGWVNDRWRHLAAQRTRAADLAAALDDAGAPSAVFGRDPMPAGGWPLVMSGDPVIRWPVSATGNGGAPCSDCCHAQFGRVAGGVQQITVNWPCRRCGRTVGELGGYHYLESCGTPVQEWSAGSLGESG